MGPTPHSRPAVRSAVRFVRKFMIESGLRKGERLPPVKLLAHAAEVSYVTMVRAVQELRRVGEVARANAHAFVVGDAPHDRTSSTPVADRPEAVHLAAAPRQPWLQVAEGIREDIVNRAFHPGTSLPSVKELCARYRVTYRPLRKALRILSAQGVLEPFVNGRYGVSPLKPARSRTRIVCFVRSHDSFRMVFGQHDEAAFRALEPLCEQARIELDIHLIFYSSAETQSYRERKTGRIRTVEELTRVDDDSVLGFIYCIPWLPNSHDMAAIAQLRACGKPLAIIDESATINPSAVVAPARSVRLYSVGTSIRPAQAVARHLLRLGHRRTAFISVSHGYTWSQQRLRSLIDAYREAGYGDGVVPFIAETTADSSKRGAERCDFASLDKAYSAWRERIDAPLRIDFDAGRFWLLSDACGRMEQRALLLPLLDQALSRRDITAWVMSTDLSATMALDHLTEKHVRVPSDLSLISFDNTLDSMRTNLSTYDFNAPAVSAAIVGFILGKKPWSDPGYEVSGFVVERGSTGPVGVARHSG